MLHARPVRRGLEPCHFSINEPIRDRHSTAYTTHGFHRDDGGFGLSASHAPAWDAESAMCYMIPPDKRCHA